MSFVVIRGTFHVKGYSPDGDSVRFQAIGPANWDLLDGPPVKLNASGHAQLRLEAIDTLETHYKNIHQPPPFPKNAMDHLMAELGITGVQWNASGTRVTQANDGTVGYILAREVEKNHRPVSFAFAGNPPEADGSPVFLTIPRVLQSVNAEMVRSGLAYPTYYKGLFPDLRNAFTGLVTAARAAGSGLWPSDETNTGFSVMGMPSITEEHVILPKLFRRLVDYLEGGGTAAGFKAHLASLAEEVLIISSAHSTHFDTVVDVVGDTVKMTQPPENLMFAG
jgi:endonuclease YncB( thermonuclease family)